MPGHHDDHDHGFIHQLMLQLAQYTCTRLVQYTYCNVNPPIEKGILSTALENYFERQIATFYFHILLGLWAVDGKDFSAL